MDATSPTPVATYGRDPKIAQSVHEKLLPDYEVVHACFDIDSALSELPAICAGELETTPSSGVGVNSTEAEASKRRAPVAIFFGGAGISEDEFERITAAVRERAPGVHFVRVQKRDVLAAGSFGPNPDVIAKIYRKKMAALAAKA
ncbi:hypothetical protein B0T26DRAFT_672128 [Lasiosphaeria miniovina]|uniref:Uncharacterized protein n=1 Tax=Lasiosphaeria miniovina TaxID=1954250 RepID=A0AA40B4F7_9PEZI|nr:uncharacterized protein B0T26DRAFT_672128 [Lasiosphaeria miniovina]KAK0727467.1 hypothetical protein B0T26DRAFT_672128 [Lasiosphaeria miniovina]